MQGVSSLSSSSLTSSKSSPLSPSTSVAEKKCEVLSHHYKSEKVLALNEEISSTACASKHFVSPGSNHLLDPSHTSDIFVPPVFVVSNLSADVPISNTNTLRHQWKISSSINDHGAGDLVSPVKQQLVIKPPLSNVPADKQFVKVYGPDGTTKYQCLFCFRAFSVMCNCTRHIRTVHKEIINGSKDSPLSKPYACLYCNRRFTLSFNMMRHMKVLHKHEERKNNSYVARTTSDIVNNGNRIKEEKEEFHYENNLQEAHCGTLGPYAKSKHVMPTSTSTQGTYFVSSSYSSETYMGRYPSMYKSGQFSSLCGTSYIAKGSKVVPYSSSSDVTKVDNPITTLSSKVLDYKPVFVQSNEGFTAGPSYSSMINREEDVASQSEEHETVIIQCQTSKTKPNSHSKFYYPDDVDDFPGHDKLSVTTFSSQVESKFPYANILVKNVSIDDNDDTATERGNKKLDSDPLHKGSESNIASTGRRKSNIPKKCRVHQLAFNPDGNNDSLQAVCTSQV